MIRLVPSVAIVTFVLGLAGARAAAAQRAADQAAAAAAPTARHVVSRTMFGDAAVIVNARGDGFVEVAVAGPKKSFVLSFRTIAARAWVDSAARMIRARPRRSNTPQTYRTDIEDPSSSGTMALRRQVTQGVSEYSVLFSDDPVAGISAVIAASEANALVAIMRRAVAESTRMTERGDSTGKAADSAAKPQPKGKAAPPRRQPASQPKAKTTPKAP